MIKIKRIYESPVKDDGFRILIDRIWPRGMTKDKARIDLWLKDIAPSDKLRKWFAHDLKKCEEFKKRYFKELKEKYALIEQIIKQARTTDVTLLYGAKEEKCNNAVALNEYLRISLKRLHNG